ncbi:putative exo-1 [Escovopsis weberi]|uniref:xylan 1,4-beta-xylosidase n=1 Tax=Escovopsis weberi TaxID=150374 RepID=A0A0M9VVG8_ESCWE|nr:putative exo-1 [Escovopsis weberi]
MSVKTLLAACAVGLIRPAFAQDNQTFVDYNVQAQPDLFPETVATLHMSFPDCENGPLKQNIVCDASADYVLRAQAVVSLFTLEELINNTQNSGPGVPRLGLPPYQVWNEALHGLDRAGFVEEAGQEFSWATSFPMPILTMAALNRTLIHQIASLIATQARAFSNAGRYGLDSYAPNVNAYRAPTWGRGQETPGEDALVLCSSYAYEYITGLQGGVDPEHLKVAATVKHFAGYDLENWHNHSRLGFVAKISQQDMAEYYTPQFLAASRDAKSRGLMCSYNSINGVPSCSSKFLMQTLLRDKWGFPEYGYVSSDCDAVFNLYNPHRFVDSQAAAAASALRAGTDIDCGQTFPFHLNESFVDGSISRGEIERSVARLYATLVRAGYFDKDSPYRQLGWDDVVETDAMDVAYEAAAQGIVLLKNDGVLPLSADVRKVALIGPWVTATTQMQGNYFGPPGYFETPLDAAKKAGYEVEYVLGTNISSDSTSGFDEALGAASRADIVIFMGGIDNTIEAEGADRFDIAWPGKQLELIEKLGEYGKPLVVLQMGGGQVDSSSLKQNSKVGALVWGGYPGQSGGRAVFDILQGKRAPAGRLTTTQYPAAYADQFPASDMSLRPDGALNPGQTYMWYTGQPVYEFGHGLFYTTFTETKTSCDELSFDITEVLEAAHPDYNYIELAPLLTFSANIANTGDVESPYTAMLFARTGDAGPAPYPNKWLVGYERLATIKPGESAQLDIPVPIGVVARVDQKGNRVLYPGKYQLALNLEESEVVEFTLTGDSVVLQDWPADDDVNPDHA